MPRSASFLNSCWLLSRIRWNYIKFLWNNGDFKIQRRGRLTRTSKNSRWKQQVCTCIKLVCTFLYPFLRDYDLKMPNFACFGVIKQATTKFISFSEPLDKVPRNSTPGELSYTWQSKWVGIIRLKEHKFFFKAKFSLPSRRWTLKVPNNERPWYI